MSRLDKITKNKNNLVHTRTKVEKAPVSLNWFYLTIIILLFSGAIYLILFSGFLNVEKYEINGYDHPELIESFIKEETGRSIIKNNILFFPKRHISDVIMGDTTIEDIKIYKKYPNAVRVEIKEIEPALIWVSAGEKYLISDRGTVMGDSDNKKLPEVYDAANIKARVGGRVASPTFINFIKQLSEKFEGATGASITRINIFDILSDVHVLSSAGWTVYLNSSKDPENQLKNLARVLEETAKSTKKIEYIDMRIDGKIFYK